MKHLYLEGYTDGSNTHSWDAGLFILDKEQSKKEGALVSAKHNLPLETKLTHKQVADAGFCDWLGKSSKPDYYILREYGS